MNSSIIPQLVRKDFLMMRKTIVIFCLVSLTAIGVTGLLVGRVPNWVLVNIAFILLLAPIATCGIVVLMKTIVAEKEKSTQLFIMSLPVTAKEFTLSKLLVNLPVFGTLWLAVSGVAFYFAVGLGLFPAGTVPFIIMILLGVLVAYVGILSVSFLFQSQSITILSICIFELGTVAYLWVIAFLDPIANHVYGPDMVWNLTAITIVSTQVLVIIAALLMTLHLQNKKRDFI